MEKSPPYTQHVKKVIGNSNNSYNGLSHIHRIVLELE